MTFEYQRIRLCDLPDDGCKLFRLNPMFKGIDDWFKLMAFRKKQRGKEINLVPPRIWDHIDDCFYGHTMERVSYDFLQACYSFVQDLSDNYVTMVNLSGDSEGYRESCDTFRKAVCTEFNLAVKEK